MSNRKLLPHEVPSWANPSSEVWFITVCCQQRKVRQLVEPGVGNALLDSIAYRHQQHLWYAHLFLLMPDHCHALLSFPSDRAMAKTVRDWKRWTARELKIDWQIDFFEHRVRKAESLSAKWEYIRQNPVRAGLVEKPDDWKYVWRPDDLLTPP